MLTPTDIDNTFKTLSRTLHPDKVVGTPDDETIATIVVVAQADAGAILGKLSSRRADVYTLEVRAGVPGSEIVRRLTATFSLRSPPAQYRDVESRPPPVFVHWWQKITSLRVSIAP